MKNLSILTTCAILAACASQPPQDIVLIQSQVKSRITYKHYNSGEWRYIAQGTYGIGNCMVMAATSFVDLQKAGYKPSMRTCRIASGEQHEVVVVNGWIVDPARFSRPVTEQEEGCLPVQSVVAH